MRMFGIINFWIIKIDYVFIKKQTEIKTIIYINYFT